MISARIGSEGLEMKTARQLGSVKVRLKPLGTDRNRRRYWLLAKGEVSGKPCHASDENRLAREGFEVLTLDAGKGRDYERCR